MTAGTNDFTDFDWAEVAGMAAKAFNKALKDRGHMNILIAGRTGVGKSTLINAMFNGDLAETGQGRPVTTGTREITKPGIPISIWDTRGLEMEAFQETLAELEKVIAERKRETDHNRHIHVAWVCIQEDGRRVEEAEIKLHEMLSRHMPVIGVVTKARADKGFRSKVQELLPQALNVVRVRALREEFDDGHSMDVLGLNQLVEITAEALPDGHKRAFVAAQKASLDHKNSESQKFIAAASAAALAAGAAPIPFADAALLVPIQVAMLTGITVTFGLDASEGFFCTLLGAAAGSMGATYVGRSIVTNVLKMVPGIGTVAGAAIAGTTAATLTAVLGEIYLLSIGAVFHQAGDTVPSPDAVIEEFKRRMARAVSGKELARRDS